MISHKHKFIFVHINKTGGTSIENSLAPYADEELEIDSLGGVEFFGQKHNSLQMFENDANKHHGFKNYFKFSIVRNPWDRIVSTYFYRLHILQDPKMYHYSNQGRRPMLFKDFVLDKEKFAFTRTLSRFTQKDFLIDSTGKVGTNFVGKFENLQEDFNIICDKIGIPRQTLPHKYGTKHLHYTDYYDEESKLEIYKYFKEDIEYFDYKFGE